MPKIIIEFSAEEQEEANTAINGWRYWSVIWDFQQFLRSEMKHGDLSDIQYVCYEKIRTKLFELIEDHKAVIE
jgi:hypothetical protein